MYEVSIYGTPVAKGSLNSRGFIDKNGRPRSHVYTPKKVVDWVSLIKSSLDLAQPFEGSVGVELVFYLHRGKTVKRNRPHIAPDIDKLTRAVLDAMTGIVYLDDGQVTDLTARKEYGDEPGVLIRAHPCS